MSERVRLRLRRPEEAIRPLRAAKRGFRPASNVENWRFYLKISLFLPDFRSNQAKSAEKQGLPLIGISFER